jgi:Lambda phage tail tube protein, TTP
LHFHSGESAGQSSFTNNEREGIHTAKFTGKGSKFMVNTAAASPPTYTEVGQVASIGGITISSDEVEVTTLDAGDYRQYIQGFKDPGECPITVLFDPALTDQGTDPNGLLGLFTSGATKECAIQINSSETGGHSFLLFEAFIRDWEYAEINPDDPQTVTPVFRITGPVTVVDVLPTTLTTTTAPTTPPAAKAA